MKKFIGWMIAFLLVAGIASFIFYKFYVPVLVAEAFVEKENPAYIPRFVQARIEEYKAPVNEGASDIIVEIHRADVRLADLLEAIDRADEDQVHMMLDELSQRRITNTNQVFDIAKKYFTVDFDIEVLRKPFNENVDMAMIRKGLKQAAYYRNEDPVDPEMARAVIKQILIQKEKEYQKSMNGR